MYRSSLWRWALLALIQLALMETLEQASVHWKESTSELWSMGLMLATLGGLVWAFWPGIRLKGSLTFLLGGIVGSGFLLLALDNLYAWYLRPNLGLYRESDWVVQNPGWQRQHRQGIARHLWGRKLVAPAFASTGEARLLLSRPQGLALLDLDTGREIAVTNSVPEEALPGARADRLDLAVLRKDGRLNAVGIGLQVAAVANHHWEADLPQDVADYWSLEWAKPQANTVLWPLAAYWQTELKLPPAAAPSWLGTSHSGSFFFRTGEGAMGVMQLTEPVENPDVLEVRYKLVRELPRANDSGVAGVPGQGG